jgi:hypothetical protein
MEPAPWYDWLRDFRVISLGLVCAIAGALIAAFVIGKPWHLPPDWGDIPTWLATIAATAAGVVAYRVYRIEARRDQVSDQERRSMQAGKVAAWYGSREQKVTQRMPNSVQTYILPEPVWGAFLRNASDLPVSDVVVRFHLPSSPASDATGNGNMHTIVKMVLPPNDAPIHLPIDEAALRIFSDDVREDAFHRVEIDFTDAQGFRWHRNIKGQLKEITTTGTPWGRVSGGG